MGRVEDQMAQRDRQLGERIKRARAAKAGAGRAGTERPKAAGTGHSTSTANTPDAPAVTRNANRNAGNRNACQCGKPLDRATASGRAPEFCSPACKQKAYRQRKGT